MIITAIGCIGFKRQLTWILTRLVYNKIMDMVSWIIWDLLFHCWARVPVLFPLWHSPRLTGEGVSALSRLFGKDLRHLDLISLCETKIDLVSKYRRFYLRSLLLSAFFYKDLGAKIINVFQNVRHNNDRITRALITVNEKVVLIIHLFLALFIVLK